MWQHVQNRHGKINPESTSARNASKANVRTQQTVVSMMEKASKYGKATQKYQDLTLYVVKYIIKECIPVSKLHGTAFTDLVNALDPR